METHEIPNQNFHGLIEMAIKDQLSWLTLASVVDELTPTIAISKQVIKILVKELENLQSKLKQYQVKASSTSEKLTFMVQNEETKIEIKDKIDNYSNDIIEIDQTDDETFEIEAQDFVRNNEEDYRYPKFSCPKCDKTFVISIALKKHLRGHETLKKMMESGEKLYTFVGDSIDQDDTVKEKYILGGIKDSDKEMKIKKSADEGKTKTKCNTCSKEFKHKKILKVHEIIHTGEVPFQCKTCKKRFNIKGNLTVHEKIHANKKEFHCKSCYKSFITKSKLLQHERIHTGEKPYECKTCSKTFRVSHHLTKHNRIHTGERPYECQTCKKSFVSYSNLRMHEGIHNKER